MFQAIVTSDHSPRALASPRMLIWRQPITRLMMPNTGSTVSVAPVNWGKVVGVGRPG